MNQSRSSVDPDGLLEYSVVFTDRSLNHMSARFQEVMRDISAMLKEVYHAEGVVVVPGGGTYAMEAVARQFATDKDCLVIRSGWFSYRWTQILETGGIPASSTVLKARPLASESHSPFTPPPIEEVITAIAQHKPDIVFAPHVETSAGIMLPQSYLCELGQAVRAAGGLFALDCIASGAVWVDMVESDVDILISAPQKGWSSSPSSGLVMLGKRAMERLPQTTSSSFACDLKKWHQIMQAYESGGHAYHATMPTDALTGFRDMMAETKDFGFAEARARQLELGTKVRALLASRGFDSVAAPGFEAPGVVVCYTDDEAKHKGSKFAAQGMQIAAGVPLQCDEPDDFQTFRIGLFGLDKLYHVDRTVERLSQVLDRIN